MARRVEITIEGESGDIRRESKRAATAIRTVDRAAISASTSIRGIGRSAAGLAAGFVGVAAVQSAIRSLATESIQFENALAQVNTISDLTAEGFADVTAQVTALSAVIPKTRADLGLGLYQTLSAGITDTSQAFEVLETSARLATAGFVSVEASVSTVTAVINAYGLAASDAGRVSDILFTTVERGVTTIPRLAVTLGTVITTASQANITFEETAAAVAAITKAGIESATATTSLNALLFGIISPSGKAAAAAKMLRIEYNLAALEAQGLQGFLQGVLKATDGNVEAIVELSGNVRAARAALVLAGGGADDFAEALDAMADSAGAADEALAKVIDTTANRGTLLRSQLGRIFQPAIDDLIRYGLAFAEVTVSILDAGASIQKRVNDLFSRTSEAFQPLISEEDVRNANALTQSYIDALRPLEPAIAQVGVISRDTARAIVEVNQALTESSLPFLAAQRRAEDLAEHIESIRDAYLDLANVASRGIATPAPIDPSFTEAITQLADGTQLASLRLEVEETESVFDGLAESVARNMEEVVRVIFDANSTASDILRSLGAAIANILLQVGANALTNRFAPGAANQTAGADPINVRAGLGLTVIINNTANVQSTDAGVRRMVDEALPEFTAASQRALTGALQSHTPLRNALRRALR